FGYLNYVSHCSSEGGLKTFRTIPPQEVVLFELESSMVIDDLLATGWRAVEVLDEQNRVHHYERGSNGGVAKEIRQQPSSSIRVSRVRDQQLRWNLIRNDEVARSANNEVVARYSQFRWRGGWLQLSMSPILGYGESCFFSRKDELLDWLRKSA